MERSRAWGDFQASRREIADLLEAARAADVTPLRGQRMALQEVLLRAAMVVLVGQLHNYLEVLLEEWGDLLGTDFEKLSPIGQKYVVLQIQRRLADALRDNPEEGLGDAPAQRKLIGAVQDCFDWLQSPNHLAASVYRSPLEGFFRQLGANAIDRTLAQFRDDGTKFFSWLAKEHAAYADYFDRLNSAIKVRNEISHGDLQSRLTIQDVRRHRATISLFVRKSERFVENALDTSRQAVPVAKS